MCAGCNPTYSMAKADRRDHMPQRYVVVTQSSRDSFSQERYSEDR